MSIASRRCKVRIAFHVTAADLALFGHAAEVQGRSLSNFVLAAAQHAAERVIQTDQIIRLSLADQERIAELLSQPPAPSPDMDRARAAHRELVRESR